MASQRAWNKYLFTFDYTIPHDLAPVVLSDLISLPPSAPCILSSFPPTGLGTSYSQCLASTSLDFHMQAPSFHLDFSLSATSSEQTYLTHRNSHPFDCYQSTFHHVTFYCFFLLSFDIFAYFFFPQQNVNSVRTGSLTVSFCPLSTMVRTVTSIQKVQCFFFFFG